MQAKALKKDKELSDDKKEINVDNKTGQEEITQTNQLALIPKTYKRGRKKTLRICRELKPSFVTHRDSSFGSYCESITKFQFFPINEGDQGTTM